MRRLTSLLLVATTAATALVITACQRADEDAMKKQDQILAKLEQLEKKVDGIAARPAGPVAGQPGQPGARPPGPDPNTVYSVDITGDAYKGPEFAKVTIVEAAEFA